MIHPDYYNQGLEQKDCFPRRVGIPNLPNKSFSKLRQENPIDAYRGFPETLLGDPSCYEASNSSGYPNLIHISSISPRKKRRAPSDDRRPRKFDPLWGESFVT